MKLCEQEPCFCACGGTERRPRVEASSRRATLCARSRSKPISSFADWLNDSFGSNSVMAAMSAVSHHEQRVQHVNHVLTRRRDRLHSAEAAGLGGRTDMNPIDSSVT